MKQDESHIIQEILNGKISQYEYFLDRYSQQVYLLIVRIVSCEEDAEELTQDVFESFPSTVLLQSRKQFLHLDIPNSDQYGYLVCPEKKIRRASFG